MKTILLILLVSVCLVKARYVGRHIGQSCKSFPETLKMSEMCHYGGICKNHVCVKYKHKKGARAHTADDDDTEMIQNEEYQGEDDYNGLAMILALVFGVAIGYAFVTFKQRGNVNAKADSGFEIERVEVTRIN